MKKVKIGILSLFVLLILPFGVFAAQINSENYKQNAIISEGGQNETSASYKINTAIGIINGILNSVSYINKVGFFHSLLLADGQPCTSANQCEGNFCCSNLCSSSSCPIGGGGGGAGAAPSSAGGGGSLPNITAERPAAAIADFSVTPSSMQEQIPLGATKTSTITIKNTGNKLLSFSLSVDTINDFVSLSDTSFSLEAGEEKIIQVNMLGKQLGSYFGDIKVEAAGIEKLITVVLDIQSTLVLFDVKVDIPSAYKEVQAGNELKEQITLFNVGSGKIVDVTPTYIIKDRQGAVVYESSETFAVERQKSYVKTIRIPKELSPGEYLSIVELRYENSFAVSSELFKVMPKASIGIEVNSSILLLIIILIGLASLFVYLLAPKFRFSGNKLKKCYKIIHGMEMAIKNNDISRARELHLEVKKIYDSLELDEKDIIYDKLKNLYEKLK